MLLQVTRTTNLSIAATKTITEILPGRNIALIQNYPPVRVEEQYVKSIDIDNRSSQIVYVVRIAPVRGSPVIIELGAH